jgi:hypothetical protein
LSGDHERVLVAYSIEKDSQYMMLLAFHELAMRLTHTYDVAILPATRGFSGGLRRQWNVIESLDVYNIMTTLNKMIGKTLKRHGITRSFDPKGLARNAAVSDDREIIQRPILIFELQAVCTGCDRFLGISRAVRCNGLGLYFFTIFAFLFYFFLVVVILF